LIPRVKRFVTLLRVVLRDLAPVSKPDPNGAAG